MTICQVCSNWCPDIVRSQGQISVEIDGEKYELKEVK